MTESWALLFCEQNLLLLGCLPKYQLIGSYTWVKPNLVPRAPAQLVVLQVLGRDYNETKQMSAGCTGGMLALLSP